MLSGREQFAVSPADPGDARTDLWLLRLRVYGGFRVSYKDPKWAPVSAADGVTFLPFRGIFIWVFQVWFMLGMYK